MVVLHFNDKPYQRRGHSLLTCSSSYSLWFVRAIFAHGAERSILVYFCSLFSMCLLYVFYVLFLHPLLGYLLTDYFIIMPFCYICLSELHFHMFKMKLFCVCDLLTVNNGAISLRVNNYVRL